LVLEDLRNAAGFCCEVAEDSDNSGNFHVLGAPVCAGKASGAKPQRLAVKYPVFQSELRHVDKGAWTIRVAVSGDWAI